MRNYLVQKRKRDYLVTCPNGEQVQFERVFIFDDWISARNRSCELSGVRQGFQDGFILQRSKSHRKLLLVRSENCQIVQESV